MASPALRLARVASDALGVIFASPGGHDWELAAADLLVHEAGSMLTTLTGNTLICAPSSCTCTGCSIRIPIAVPGADADRRCRC
jgi:fructose-1,6-bisphosphatase/inositol monophosphatase family enzyme